MGVTLSTLATLKLLKRVGLHRPVERQVLISHPSIWPEVALLGRSGVRLPYIKHFGLHYQVHADRSVMTFMPGVDWKIPNEVVAEELGRALSAVRDITTGADRR